MDSVQSSETLPNTLSICDLPEELLVNILSYLSFYDRKLSRQVCKLWNEVSYSHSLIKNDWLVVPSVPAFAELRIPKHRNFSNVRILFVASEYEKTTFWEKFGPNIDKIELIYAWMKNPVIVDILKSCTNLRSLTLFNLVTGTRSYFPAIFADSAPFSLPKLEYLKMNGISDILDKEFIALTENAPNLKEFYLNDYVFTKEHGGVVGPHRYSDEELESENGDLSGNESYSESEHGYPMERQRSSDYENYDDLDEEDSDDNDDFDEGYTYNNDNLDEEYSYDNDNLDKEDSDDDNRDEEDGDDNEDLDEEDGDDLDEEDGNDNDDLDEEDSDHFYDSDEYYVTRCDSNSLHDPDSNDESLRVSSVVNFIKRQCSRLTHLGLSKINIPEKVRMDLISSMGKQIKCLQIKIPTAENLQKTCIQTIAEKFPDLESIEITASKVEGHNFTKLFSSLPKVKKFKMFRVKTDIANALYVLSYLDFLREIDLSVCKIRYNDIKGMDNKVMPNIKILAFNHTILNDDVIRKISPMFPNVIHLSFNYSTNLGDIGLKEIVKNNKFLRFLSLIDCVNLTTVIPDINQLTDLRSLDLTNCKGIPKSSIMGLSLENLQKLNLNCLAQTIYDDLKTIIEGCPGLEYVYVDVVPDLKIIRPTIVPRY